MPTYADRKKAIDATIDKVKLCKALLEKAGLACEQITGSGTGTYCFEFESGIFTELQVGSYIFMDADYGKIQGKDGKPYRDFEHSLFVILDHGAIPNRTMPSWMPA